MIASCLTKAQLFYGLYLRCVIHVVVNVMIMVFWDITFLCLVDTSNLQECAAPYSGWSIVQWICISVYQSVVGNIVAFRVHAPCSGAFLLDIFANAVTPKEYLTGEPMKFKSVCKFKIACEDLQTVMVPLPDCASGEWGPTKATRLFGLVPITHQVRICTIIAWFNVPWS